MSDLQPFWDGPLKENYLNRWWRIQNLYKIRDKNKRLTNLRFNTIQLNIIKDIVPFLDKGLPIRHWDLKYRQGGVSTFWLIFWLDDTIFTPNTITGVLADKHDNLRKLMKIIRVAWETMPSQIRPELEDDSKERLSFSHNKSEMFAALSIRSTALHNLHISEWCFCADDEIRGTLGAASPATNISGESTGNGLGNDGYETYMEAKKKENGYIARFSPWFIQKEYRLPLNGIDPARLMDSLTPQEKKLQALMRKYKLALSPEQVLWRRDTYKSLKEMATQEFPETDKDAFLASGDSFFNPYKIEALYAEAREWEKNNKPYAVDEKAGRWIQFKAPVKGHRYAAGADTAEGGGDAAALKIIDVTAKEEVFAYRAPVSVPVFYNVCNDWARLYHNALLGVERNNHGHAVLLALDEACGYPNLFDEGMLGDSTRMRIDEFPKKKLGWLTGEKNRMRMLNGLKSAIEGNFEDDVDGFETDFTVYDKLFLSECLTFRDVEGKLQAVPGKHDDTIFASGIANQMFQILVKQERTHSGEYAFIGGKRHFT